MKTRFERGVAYRWLGGMVLLCLIAGCHETKTDDSNLVVANTLPKLDFHRPKTLADAVGRLRQIHDAVTADEPLPKPLEFDVLEVVHGTGAGAVSYTHLTLPTIDAV